MKGAKGRALRAAANRKAQVDGAFQDFDGVEPEASGRGLTGTKGVVGCGIKRAEGRGGGGPFTMHYEQFSGAPRGHLAAYFIL